MILSWFLATLILLGGAVFGAMVVWLAGRANAARAEEQALQAASLREEHAVVRSELSRLGQEVGRLEASNHALERGKQALEREVQELKGARDLLLQERQASIRTLAEVTTNLANERRQSAEKLALLDEARGRLAQDFEIVASRILDEKSKRFTEQNRSNLDQVLSPFKEQLSDFRRRVEEAQKASSEQSTELKLRIGQLQGMNSQLSQEAANLARALRVAPGRAGQLGDEFLRQVLETMGLQEGINYDRQSSFRDEAGANLRPDYILHLPGNRHVVIDAKMSLKDYDDYCNAPDEASREASLARHLRSVRNHVGGLTVKGYQTLHGLNSLDFVVMFMPVESAFHVAFAKEDVWRDAWGKNILLASPSTLLFVFRTVADLWKQETQTQSVREIVKRGGALYDKFVGFVQDLETVGAQIDRAKGSYLDAHRKLTSGDGNLTRQVEMLRTLGVKHKGKALPAELVANAIQPGDDELLQLAASEEQGQADLDWDGA